MDAILCQGLKCGFYSFKSSILEVGSNSLCKTTAFPDGMFNLGFLFTLNIFTAVMIQLLSLFSPCLNNCIY